jgi:hypothetical protein
MPVARIADPSGSRRAMSITSASLSAVEVITPIPLLLRFIVAPSRLTPELRVVS